MLIVAGIDPGSLVTGVGVIAFEGRNPRYLYHTTIKVPSGYEFPSRCDFIHSRLSEILKEYSPSVGAIEKAFVSNNPSSALKLGLIRGAVMLSLSLNGLKVVEVSPREVKMSVTGFGGADKRQVNGMVKRILDISGKIPMDASDALAIALTAGYLLTSNLSL